ncbi:patatin-like phospholipase family protein [Hymenobacter lutimineralis]|uniref:Patatin-like phospholipase family protein n=1 Tax=Hymenobacter lutimineralis TaxID=2606448 RepID=A0A5D6VBQ7_9BACT|nr:CBASS cGAMP-activated phospholipase [Hymenobacter lutimineralis]TYZ12685.1 patatin-like phospholipase family protein [Hymenobacter lutimineralis]
MNPTSPTIRRPFRILSLDGGGIRGLYTARFLADFEAQLQRDGNKHTSLYQHFDLICGTSTGGIIALALALGMPARELVHLYSHHAKDIFGAGRSLVSWLGTARYSNKKLEALLKEKFAPYSPDGNTRLGHARTRVCIPVFNAVSGKVSVYKTCHHGEYTRDYQMPAYQVGMSTAAAPTYFDPYSPRYQADVTQEEVTISHNVDGGIFANNPALIGLTEAHGALAIPWADIRLLSIGTGNKRFAERPEQKNWGLFYWVNKKRILDMLLHAQADYTDNVCKVLSQGVGRESPQAFLYERVQFDFLNKQEYIDLDTTDPAKLADLQERASNHFKDRGRKIINDFCTAPAPAFTPCLPLRSLAPIAA